MLDMCMLRMDMHVRESINVEHTLQGFGQI